MKSIKKCLLLLFFIISIASYSQSDSIYRRDSTSKISFKVWRGNLTQDGTNPPYVSSYGPTPNTPFENTLGNIVWTRYNVGQYIGYLQNGFPAAKTWISFVAIGNATEKICMRRTSDNTILIITLNSSDVTIDDKLNNTSLEIIVRY